LARVLEPLEAAAVKKLEEWLPKLPYPDRSGQHANTAFALGLAIDSAGAPWLRAHARDFTDAIAMVRSRLNHRAKTFSRRAWRRRT